MTFETEAWIAPLVMAILARRDGGASFAGVLDRAVQTGAVSKEGVDWVNVGLLMREQLGWDAYPPLPLALMN
ncbi:MAG: hypothetical protein ABIQ73_25630 [Acidimicrobiales bacterium]